MARFETLDSALVSYLLERIGLSDWYVNQLGRSVAQFTAWNKGTVTLDRTMREKLLSFMRFQFNTGKSPATVNTNRRRVLTLATYSRLKIAKVPRIPEPLPMPEAWTLGQCERIFAECGKLTGYVGTIHRRDWWLSLALAVYWTGERIKAVRSIRREDCDFQSGTMIVRAENHKSRRDCVLWIPQEVAGLMVQNSLCGNEPLAWPWPHCRRHLFTQFRRIVEASGVPCPKRGHNLFHRLRRTSGTLVEAAGGDGARHLGHSRAVFEKHYLDRRLVGSPHAKLLPTPKTS